MQKSTRQLPTILCLHGSGTSAEIFEVQTLKLRWALRSYFHFIYIDAPFETAPGPGVLPFFADSGPFYAWQPSNTTTLGKMTPETTNLLADVFAKREACGSPVTAVLGFSQGARVATGLLLARHDSRFSTLQSGMLFNSTFPAMIPDVDRLSFGVDESVTVPTVIVHGMLDPYLPQSRAIQAAHFSGSLSVLLEFKLAHQIPTLQDDVEKLATLALRTLHTNTLRRDSHVQSLEKAFYTIASLV